MRGCPVGVNFAINNDVTGDRRDYVRRRDVQCRVLAWLCSHPEGSTGEEAAAVVAIPTSAARRLLRRLASRYLVRCTEGSRWEAEPILLIPSSVARIEPY